MGRAAGLVALICLLGVVCGNAQAQAGSSPRWQALRHLAGAVDVVGPRLDGRFVVATSAGLFLMSPGRTLHPFARGYVPIGGEPYVALAPRRRLGRERCSFRRDDVYALDLGAPPGIVRIDGRGRPHRFATLPADVFLSGIAFDGVGRFGHRLLVTGVTGATMTLFALDCRGRARTIGAGLPRAEGGMAVAPAGFARFAGQLIAADEHSGHVLAFSAGGRARVVVESGMPFGADVGVESLGFVPPGFDRRGRALLADPGGQPGATRGTDSVLALSGRSLLREGVRGGDLLVAREAGAETIRIRCRARCTVRRVAIGPAATHAEGHITFATGRRASRRGAPAR